VTGRLQTVNLALRVQQFVSGVSGHAGLAHGQQDAGGVEYQSPAWAEEPGRFGDPAGRVAPQAGAALGDNQVEAAGAERDVSGVSLQEREWEPEMFLAAAGGAELGWGEVHADGPRPAPGEPGGEVRGAAPKLGYIQAGDFSQHVKLGFRDVEDSPGDLITSPCPEGMLIGVISADPRPQITIGVRLHVPLRARHQASGSAPPLQFFGSAWPAGPPRAGDSVEATRRALAALEAVTHLARARLFVRDVTLSPQLFTDAHQR
jgi:hypothetical protein